MSPHGASARLAWRARRARVRGADAAARCSRGACAQNHTSSGAETSDIHIDRHAGDVLQFHSFYRDVRKQLAGANGWKAELGRYVISNE